MSRPAASIRPVSARAAGRADGVDRFADPRNDKMPFDILSGSDELRRQLEAEAPVADIAESWRDDEKTFQQQRAQFLMY